MMQVKSIHLKDFYPFLGENDCDPVLDCYIQDNTFADYGVEEFLRPAILVFPGGAYYIRCKREGEPFALEFSAEGYQAFVLQYSVAPNKYPTQIIEVAAALDYIVKNAKEFQIDVEKLVISGFSAGGHLAASYSTMATRPEVANVIKPTKIAAQLLIYPVITADGATNSATFNAILGHENWTEEEINMISCEKHVSDFTPPAFIFATSNDNAVPIRNSLKFAEALAEKGINYELHIFPDGPHGVATSKFGTFADYNDKSAQYNATWINDAKRFLKNLFGY